MRWHIKSHFSPQFSSNLDHAFIYFGSICDLCFTTKSKSFFFKFAYKQRRIKMNLLVGFFQTWKKQNNKFFLNLAQHLCWKLSTLTHVYRRDATIPYVQHSAQWWNKHFCFSLVFWHPYFKSAQVLQNIRPSERDEHIFTFNSVRLFDSFHSKVKLLVNW